MIKDTQQQETVVLVYGSIRLNAALDVLIEYLLQEIKDNRDIQAKPVSQFELSNQQDIPQEPVEDKDR